MKKMMVFTACLLMLLIVLTGCCSNNKLSGTWKLVEAQGMSMDGFETEMIEMVTAFGGNVKLTFTDKNMTLRAEMFGSAESQTQAFKVKGNTLTMDNGNVMNFEIKGDMLTLSQNESNLVWTKLSK